MNKYDAIVVGGGLGGLTAGARLAKNGKKVLLLEQHYIPGGCATTFKRKEFIAEVGLHEMDGLDQYDGKKHVFDELEVRQNVEFVQVPEFYRIQTPAIDFVMPDDVEGATTALMERFPSETKGIKKFFDLMTGLRKEVSRLPRNKWLNIILLPLFPVLFPRIVTLTGPWFYLSALTNPLFWVLRFKHVFNIHRNVGDYFDSTFHDEELKMILLANLSYYHDDPYTMSLFYFLMAQGGYLQGGGHFVKGGSQKLSDHLSNIITNNEGEVLLDSKVTNILLKDGKAIGIAYKSTFGKEEAKTLYAEHIVVNAAVPVVAKMLPSPYREELLEKIRPIPYSCSLTTIYLGFDIDLKTINSHYSSMFASDGFDIKNFSESFKVDYDKRTFIFVDYSQVDSKLAKAGQSFGTICFVDYIQDWDTLSPEEYKAKKQTTIEIFKKRLEEKIPSSTKHIIYEELSTPITVQRYTMNPAGSVYGFAQTPQQTSLLRFKGFGSVSNLYFASAWAFPGGGMTGAIIGGDLAAESILSSSSNSTLEAPSKLDTRKVVLLENNTIAENTLELVIQKPEGFTYQAGQYAILRIDEPNSDVNDIYFRPLSIASHPNDNELRFTMRKSDSGFKQSCITAKVSDPFHVFGPMGEFVLPTELNKPIVFLAAGVGITPIYSMLKELASRKCTKKVALIYSSKTKVQCAYHDELKDIELKDYLFAPIFSGEGTRLNENMMKELLGDLSQYSYYIVGTSSYIASVKTILSNNKITDFKIDDFG